MSAVLVEVRCRSCGRKLAEIEQGRAYAIRCPRTGCHWLNQGAAGE